MTMIARDRHNILVRTHRNEYGGHFNTIYIAYVRWGYTPVEERDDGSPTVVLCQLDNKNAFVDHVIAIASDYPECPVQSNLSDAHAAVNAMLAERLPGRFTREVVRL